jgi:universal stress protein E
MAWNTQQAVGMVVAVDFSPASRNALKQACRLAKARNRPLQALHVVETLVAVSLADELSAFQAQILSSLMEDASGSWKIMLQDVPEASAVPFRAEMNSPVLAITQQCKASHADLLVLGTHGSSSGEQGAGLLAGSCVRRSPCDVLLVHPSATGAFKTILVCVDFSPTSKKAVERAMQLAALEGAAVHVAYVFTPLWEKVKPKVGSPEATEAFKQSYEKALTERVATFCKEIDQAEMHWAKPHFHAVPGANHGKTIASFAKVLGADLVVIGTRGASNIHDMLLGSTAERVLKETHRSILAVRPSA